MSFSASVRVQYASTLPITSVRNASIVWPRPSTSGLVRCARRTSARRLSRCSRSSWRASSAIWSTLSSAPQPAAASSRRSRATRRRSTVVIDGAAYPLPRPDIPYGHGMPLPDPRSALAALAAVAALYALAVVALIVLGRRGDARALARFVPDCVVLVARLAADRRVPRRARWLLVVLAGYLALPFDLVPDIVP